MDCNRLAVDIDNEMAIVHNFIRDKYRLKFPELESLVGSRELGWGLAWGGRGVVHAGIACEAFTWPWGVQFLHPSPPCPMPAAAVTPGCHVFIHVTIRAHMPTHAAALFSSPDARTNLQT